MAIHKAILAMLASAPVTDGWLWTLDRILDGLDPGDTHAPNESIAPTLERWARLPVPDEGGFPHEGVYTTLTRRDEFRCIVAGMYGRHYTRDKDNKFVSVDLGRPDSPNVVHRCAYYGRATLTEAEMKSGFARDEDVYLLAVLCNASLLQSPERRRLLEGEQLRGNLRYVYQRRCDQIHKRRPLFDPRPVSEWMQEESPLPSEEVTILRQLETTMTAASKSLTIETFAEATKFWRRQNNEHVRTHR